MQCCMKARNVALVCYTVQVESGHMTRHLILCTPCTGGGGGGGGIIFG